jgi:hypothetical protein
MLLPGAAQSAGIDGNTDFCRADLKTENCCTQHPDDLENRNLTDTTNTQYPAFVQIIIQMKSVIDWCAARVPLFLVFVSGAFFVGQRLSVKVLAADGFQASYQVMHQGGPSGRTNIFELSVYQCL